MSSLLQQVSDLPTLGVGVVYVPGLETLVESRPDLINVVEVEPSTFWMPPSSADDQYAFDTAALQTLLDFSQPKIVHGVGFPLGGTLFPDPRHLPALNACVTRLSSPWVSEHLSFNQMRLGGQTINTGFLLPPLQSWAGVERAAACIDKARASLTVPLSVETGVNYLRPRPGELSDGAFVAAVCDQADCGILLDLHNLWTNERNGRQSAVQFIEELPLERIWELHIAGGFEYRAFWIDAHSGRISPEVISLAKNMISRLPNIKAIVFEIMPSYLRFVTSEQICQELRMLHEVWRERPSPAFVVVNAPGVSAQHSPATLDLEPAKWETALGALVLGIQTLDPLPAGLSDEPGVTLWRELIKEFRAGMILDAAELTCTLINLNIGKKRLRALMEDFWKQSPPKLFAAEEGYGFLNFLEAHELTFPHLDEVLWLERAIIDAALTRKPKLINFRHPPEAIIAALRSSQMPPADLPEGDFAYTLEPPALEIVSAEAA